MSFPKINLKVLEKSHWNSIDRKNAEQVIEFVQLLMNEHNFDEISRQYAGRPYKQHNRNIADGIEGVVKAVGDLVENAPEFSYDVKQIYVDGEHVILHSHATLKAKHRGDDSQGFNIIDTWKIVDGQLVEHWDAVQGISFSMRLYALLSGGKVRNPNGVF
ncbi:nuclear transport factor 2 family protein [Shewanella sedimentimangrovi]|uniref:Nuclear transport factor 2 family protein n=1 Tax=Shewanella sedimentimangrovi TaxID=2814293 RepID=A0ABX7R329_9GAMM|nr:nuclear transport factor 2 family protein [Shewanella sedimentimangrovi]QSX38232.1 nuclear transport factor 2 family protein [Shewanella sedimentimangrovi]